MKKYKNVRRFSLALAAFMFIVAPFTTLGSVTAYAAESTTVTDISQIMPGRLSVSSPNYRIITEPLKVISRNNPADTIYRVSADKSAGTDSQKAQTVRSISKTNNTPVYDSDEFADLVKERYIREQTWIRSLLSGSYNENDALKRASFCEELSSLTAANVMETGGFDNIIPAGALLTKDAFDGCTVTYNGRDTYTIALGINEIDVVVTVTDSDRHGSVINVDRSSPQLAYRADTNLISATGGSDAKVRKGKVWKTKLFLIGVPNYADEVTQALTTGKPLVHNRILKPQQNVKFDKNGRAISPQELYARFVKAIEESDDPEPKETSWPVYADTESDQDLDSFVPSSMNSSDEKISRTIMIYMNGSDLESDNYYATKSIQEMMKALRCYNGDDLRVIVMTGGTNTWHVTDEDDKNNQPWNYEDKIHAEDLVRINADGSRSTATLSKNNQIWEIREGKMILLEDDFNSGHGMMERGTLASFLLYAANLYETDLKDIIFWDHGNGPEGYGSDEVHTEKSHLSIKDLRDAFDDAFYAQGLYFDFIAFDACLMGNTELTFTLQCCADYLLASEELTPGAGWDYGFLKTLADYPSLNTYNLGKVIIDSYIDKNNENERGVTMSLVDMTRFWRLQMAVEELSNALYSELTTPAQYDEYFSLVSTRKKAEDISFQVRSGYGSGDLIDLGVFCKLLSQDPNVSDAVRSACNNVLNQLGDDAATDIKDSEYTGIIRYARQTSNVSEELNGVRMYPSGLSIYFPYRGVYVRSGSDGNDVERYRILDLLKVYDETTVRNIPLIPVPYKNAVAALALRQITGNMIGKEWKDTVTADEIYRLLNGTSENTELNNYYRDRNVKTILTDSGMSEETVRAILEKQIAERIRASEITITPVTDGSNATPTGYTVAVGGTNENVLKQMDVKISFTGIKKDNDGQVVKDNNQQEVEESISLGRTSLYGTKTAADENGVTYSVRPFDHNWFTVGYSLDDAINNDYTAVDAGNLDYQISSFYYLNEDDGKYVGVIPVCVWNNTEDMNSYAGSDRIYNAYRDDKISVYLLNVSFEKSNGSLSDTGSFIGLTSLDQNGESRTAQTSLKGSTGYELLGNADTLFTDSGMAEEVRSIGMVKTDDNGALIFRYQPVKDIDTVYTLVDAYGRDYDLTEDNLKNGDGTANDTSNAAASLNGYARATQDDNTTAISIKDNDDKAILVEKDVLNNPTSDPTGTPGTDVRMAGAADMTDESVEMDETGETESADMTEESDELPNETAAVDAADIDAATDAE